MNWKVCLVAISLASFGCGGEEAALTGDQPDAAGSTGDRPDASDNGGGDSADADTGELPLCQVPGRAIVSDIDATLTTSDTEWLLQLFTGTHDPAERAGGAALINDYADRGYFVLYLTARPADSQVGLTGRTAADVTLEWLTAHGYPVDPDHTRVVLAPGLVFGDSAADYKGGALMDMQAEGFTFEYAYGNATSDIAAYAAAGIDKADTFIIGPEAGVDGTVAVAGEDWLEHTASFVESLPAICRWQ